MLDFSIGSALERLVLTNFADCTSQRLKWTSGGGSHPTVAIRILGPGVDVQHQLMSSPHIWLQRIDMTNPLESLWNVVGNRMEVAVVSAQGLVGMVPLPQFEAAALC